MNEKEREKIFEELPQLLGSREVFNQRESEKRGIIILLIILCLLCGIVIGFFVSDYFKVCECSIEIIDGISVCMEG